MSIINKAAVLNPFTDLTANILDYVPRATTSEFGIVAIGSGINVDALGRIYLDTQEYSDRLTAIEAQAASSLTTQQTEVAAAIAQVNLTQSQTITALSLEVSNLKTDLTNSITATQTDLINRADQLAQDVTDITVQLTQDKATFTQEIQDALVYLQNESSVASALRTPRKIQGVAFDGTGDINLDVYSKAEVDTAIANATPTIPNATETVAGTAKIATQVDVYVTTDDTRFVTPKKLLAGLKYHLNATSPAPMFACRAWVNFNGVGDVAIKASGNVSSVTDNGVGDYTLNFAIPMPNANYSISSGGAESSDGTPAVLSLRMGAATPLLKSISAVRISTRSPYTGILLDVNNISVQVFC